jgi:glycosyltransferase involved in cell wall biosynthesis
MLKDHHHKLKILICGPLPPPNYGPSIVYQQLLDLDLWSNYKITFLKLNYFNFQKSRAVRVLQVFKLFIHILRYLYIIITNRPKYIILSISFDKSPFYKDLLFIVIGKLFKKKIIQYDMGQYATDFYNEGNSLQKKLFKFIINNITAYLVQGYNTKKKYKFLIDEKKTYVLPCYVNDSIGIPTLKFEPAKNKVQLDILFFSLLTDSKGLWTALKAIPKVLEHNKNVMFNFVGAVDSELTDQKITKFVEENMLQHNFKYKGYAKDSIERTMHFRNSDIFIFPTNRDTFGLVLLHAMAESKPVISTIEGNIPEIITHNKNGYLINKNDSDKLALYILKLANNENIRERIGTQNRRDYETKYSINSYSHNLKLILSSIENCNNKDFSANKKK